MKTTIKHILVLTALAGGLASTAQAALTLHLDTTAKALWMTGTDTGKPTSGSDGAGTTIFGVMWSNGQTQGDSRTTIPKWPNGLTPMVQVTGADFVKDGNGDPEYDALRIDTAYSSGGSVNDPYTWLAMEFQDNQGSAITIEGTGVNNWHSYDALVWDGGSGVSSLESWIGKTWPLSSTAGSGFAPINIVADTVPEPSSLAPLLGLCGVAFFLRRRK